MQKGWRTFEEEAATYFFSSFLFVPRAFHNNRHANRRGVRNLDQWICHVGMGHECSLGHHSTGIDRIGGRRVNRFDAVARSGDGYGLRIGDHLRHVDSAGESSDHAWTNFDVSSCALVERKVELTGYDLHHFQALR